MSSFRTAINFFSSSLTGYKGFKKLCKYILFSIFYTAFSNTFRQTMDVENLTMFMFIRLAMTYTPSLGVVSEEWDNNSILDEYLYILFRTLCHLQHKLWVKIFRLYKKPFNLHNLPYPAYRKIVLQMDICDMLQLSRTSSNTCLKTKKVNRKIYKLMISDPKLHDNNLITEDPLRQVYVIESKADLDFIYSSIKRVYGKNEGMFSSANFNYWIRTFCEHQKEQEKFRSIPYANSEELHHLLNFINQSVIVDELDLLIHHNSLFGDYKSILSHQMLDNCHDVEIFGPDFSLRNDEVNILLDRINLSGKLSIECMFSSSFNKEILFNIPQLEIWNALSFTLQDVMNMNCEVIILQHHILKSLDINRLIHYWLAGKMPNLRRIRVNANPDAKMLRGIVNYAWHPRRRPQVFRDGLEQLDCENGMDIVRSDGRIATLLDHNSFVDFLVWPHSSL
ncbi:F-box domain-containing protein [Caenorhabditis elegans]|uniref:F-box domain-containing protein n=1 Tax=Caenorhabditis elegans TaxID=6239 RepID=E1B6V7_CAEEL|nr:F-box domain-containing protein [Caenorhabditis elegans]CBW48435.1 F-box domain-containing protein [Caenorhabditis elegans]|eukprot:NP_001251731.1 Uncharacterized protein CELE_T02G6.5 [Caenorhabditis elegans]